MGIDFADPGNRRTYAARTADREWAGFVGVDGSAAMVSGARERAASPGRARGSRAGGGALRFVVADAADTGLTAGAFDAVLQRALIHHVADLRAVFAEARRILRPGGSLIVQDRTMADVARPGSPEHPRGYFFERYPRLLEVERARRPRAEGLQAALAEAGFDVVRQHALAEVRREYASVDELAGDLRSRTGRSILHELDDAELADLVDFVASKYPDAARPRETDHWTVWTAR
ncbi:class I SAM-dependent methyltransferase [Zhihengliuella alba]|uniref:Class I SAM-dependent methyltransferase n=1 Tax=Zhihengliuella alba TaxID=547018 RepID=A0ABP7DMI8_9MICC